MKKGAGHDTTEADNPLEDDFQDDGSCLLLNDEKVKRAEDAESLDNIHEFHKMWSYR